MNTALAQSTETKPEKARITTRVAQQIEELRGKGLVLPADYNVSNALESAWLYLQTVQDLNRKPVIKNMALDTSVVSQVSVTNTLLDYVVQGLNVAKKQAYFIVYGGELVCQRSYFGDMLVAKRVRPDTEFYYDVIYEGEEVKVEKTWSPVAGLVDDVTNHVKPFPRNTGQKIVGAYCGAVDTLTGQKLGCVVFDMARIQKSWKKSKTYKPESTSGAHAEFPDEMALRTVIRRRCKTIINSSADQVFLEAVRRSEDDAIEAQVTHESELHGNGEVLSIESKVSAAAEESFQTEEPVKEPVPVQPSLAEAAEEKAPY